MAGWRDRYDKAVKEQLENNGDAITGQTIFQSNGAKKIDRVENPLHQYASYNYVLTLSALSRVQLENPKSILSDPLHDIIARTGGIGNANGFGDPSRNLNYNFFKDNPNIQADRADTYARNLKLDPNAQARAEYAIGILKQNRDIYFETLEIKSIPGPNRYRKMMNYTTIEMTLTEPTGISFWQKIRGAAFNCGYLEHLTAPFLLTVEFKGFNSQGVEVANDIIRKMPIQISRSTLSVNAGGTTYTVSAVPWTEYASQNRYLYTRAQGTIEGTDEILSTYLKSFQNNLNEAQEREVKENLRTYPDVYKITADPKIGKALRNVNNYSASDGVRSQFKSVQYQKSESIGYVLEKFVRQFDQFRKIDEIVKNYWKEVTALDFDYDSNSEIPSPWVPWFKVITTVKVENDWDPILKSHPRTIHFHIKPYNIHVANFAQAGVAGFASWRGLVRKKYNYIYTGQNLDILDLSVDYNGNYAKASLLNEPYATQQKTNHNIVEYIKSFGSSILSFIFGGNQKAPNPDEFSPYPDPDHPLRQVITTATSEDGTTIGKEDSTPVAAFYDYLTNNYGDMITLDMKIMGDPAYLGQDAFIPMTDPGESNSYSKVTVGSVNGFDWDSQRGCFNTDEYQPIVSLDFRFPSDFNENQGLYEFTQNETPQFSGLYKLSEVLSEFNRGQFTQTLKMYRLENQFGGGPVSTTNKQTNSTDATPKSNNQSPYPDINADSA